MVNPLLQRKSTQTKAQPQQASSLRQQVQQLRQQGPSSVIFDRMYQNNPVLPDGRSFRDVFNQVRNMTPEEAFRQNGLDFNQVRNLKW